MGPAMNSRDNQSGIALECILPKVLNSVLRNPMLLSVQSGFWPGRSTIEQAISIIEACKTRHKSVSIVLVDFKKAFDKMAADVLRRHRL
jgi:hypothetical protein